MDYLFWGVCIILFIMMLINQTKKVKSSEAYVIERHKRFYKVVSSKVVFIIPFLDKIKCVVNLDSHIKKCYPAPIILADNTTILVNINIVFKVIDACKVAYSDKSLESHLEYLAITELRSISRKLDSSNVKYIDDKVEEDLKSILNRKGQDLGCKIEALEIKIRKNTDTNNIDNYYEESSLVYSTNKMKTNILLFVSYIIIFIFSVSSAFFVETYAGKRGLHNLLILIISYHAFIGLSLVLIINIFTTRKINKNKQILINIIILIIYLLTAPCIDLIEYVPNDYNSHIGNNFVILSNVISDILSDETYEIQATTYQFVVANIQWHHGGSDRNVKSSYVRFDNSFNIPISPKDQMIIKLLFNSDKINTITLYKKSGLIKSINGKPVNISYEDYFTMKEELKKELADKQIRAMIEDKKDNLFQIWIEPNGKVTRSTLGEYEKEIDLFWLIKKDGKEIQRLEADTLSCTFNDNGDKTSKYTMSLIGFFQGEKYQLSKEIKLYVFLP